MIYELSAMNVKQRFISFITEKQLFQKKDRLLLAVSGGVDSVVLFHLCHAAGFDYSVAHCNFKLRGADSDRDEQFVKDLAAQYEAPFFCKSFDTVSIAKEQKKSIEETARDLRYEWFTEIVNSQWSMVNDRNKFIVTAHHADDNIETVLMNFFRGTGIKGLHGILPMQNNIVRPLLFARKKELEAYAAENKLSFVSDHTNAESAFTRNFFRNKLVPQVRELFPAAEENILDNIARFSEAEILYEQAIVLHKKKLLEKRGNEIHIPVLKLKKSFPLKTIIYEIIREYGFSSLQADEVMRLLDSESGRYISSGTHRVIKNRNWLIIAPEATKEAGTIVIDKEGNYEFPGGRLCIESTTNYKPQTTNIIACLDAREIEFPLILRKWKQGDYFYPLGMKKKKKLSRFFIDQKLSKTDKENVWVLESGKKVVWVIGQRIDERFRITDKTDKGFLVTVR